MAGGGGVEIIALTSSSSSEEGNEEEEDCIVSTNANNKEEKKKRGEVGGGVGPSYSCCSFPMSRIKRLMKSEGVEFRTTPDAVFLINKSTEQFLELFAGDAYACAVGERKKSVNYEHLSSVVINKNKYEFLSDFVPEKLRAKDALSAKLLTER